MDQRTLGLGASGIKRIAFEEDGEGGWIATAQTVAGEVLAVGKGHSIPEARTALDEGLKGA